MSNASFLLADSSSGEALSCVPDTYYSCGPTNDPYWANVVLMLHMDGVNGGTTFTDSSVNTKTVSAVSGVTTSTAQSKFNSNGLFAGRLTVNNSTDFSFGGSDFTIEFWIYPTAATGSCILQHGNSGSASSAKSIYIEYGSNRNINFWIYYASDSSNQNGTPVDSVPLNTWTHVAIVRKGGGTIQVFCDGILRVSDSGSSTFGTAPDPVYLGNTNGSAAQFAGRLDDLRITKGIARYTGNFSIPTAAFPDAEQARNTSVNNALLLNFNGTNGSATFTDSSPNAAVPTVFGGAVLTTDASKRTFGTAAGDFSAGASTYIRFAASAALRLIGAFTIRFTFTPASSGLTSRNFFSISNGTSYQWFNTDGAGMLQCYVLGSQTVSTVSPVAGTKYFLMVTRNALNEIQWYINGVQQPSMGVNATNHSANAQIEIGASPTVSGGGTGYPCYIDDLQILSGFAAPSVWVPTAEFTQPQLEWVDPARTVLSLHAETATDSSCAQTKTVTLTGAASISTAEKKFGTSSFLIPNTGSPVTNGVVVGSHQDFSFGIGDFAIELWGYRNANTWAGLLFQFFLPTGQFYVTVGTDGLIDIFYSSSAAEQQALNVATWPLTTWVYFVVQRRGTNWETYLNGSLINSLAISGGAGSTVNSSQDWYIGGGQASSATRWNGYIDEFRVTKGAARYTPASFSAPTAAFPDDSSDPHWESVISLVHFNEAHDTAIPVDVVNPSNAWTGATGGVISLAKTTSARFGSAGWRHQMAGGIAGGIRRDFTALPQVPFTMEGHIRITAAGAYGSTFHRFGNLTCTSSSAALGFSYNSSNGRLMVNTQPASEFDTATSMALNQWHHVAVCRTAAGLQFFLNGVLVHSAAGWFMPAAGNNWAFTPDQSLSNGGYFDGDLDDWRLTWGVARYSSDFTPPAKTSCDFAPFLVPPPAAPPESGGAPQAFTALAAQDITLDSSTGTLVFAEKATFTLNGQILLTGSFGQVTPTVLNWATPTVANGAIGFEYFIHEGSFTDSPAPVGWQPLTAEFIKSSPLLYGSFYSAGILVRFSVRKISTPEMIAEYTIRYRSFGTT